MAPGPKKGYKQSAEHKEKIKNALLGVPHTAERIEKMRKSLIGRKLSEEHKKKISPIGRKHSDETKNKIAASHMGKKLSAEHKKSLSIARMGKTRIVTEQERHLRRLNRILEIKEKCGQIMPNFNSEACCFIDEYGKDNGYKFQHAMNGGEYYIKELGYFVDGYDKDKNIILEIDEKKHFNFDGSLRKKDIIRQIEIKNLLGCMFIRFKLELGNIFIKYIDEVII